MAKKPVTKKKSTGKTTESKAKKKAAPKRASTAKVNVSVGRDIKAKNIVMGNQTNTINRAGRDVVQKGNVTNTTVTYAPQQVIQTPAEFAAELQKLRDEIVRLKTQPQLAPAHHQMLEVVEGNVITVMDEMQKPQPLGARISATLTGAQAVMNSLAGGVASAVALGTALAGLGQIALKVFGG